MPTIQLIIACISGFSGLLATLKVILDIAQFRSSLAKELKIVQADVALVRSDVQALKEVICNEKPVAKRVRNRKV